MSVTERNLLCLHVMHGSTDDIVQTISSIGTLRRAVIKRLLEDEEQAISKLCSHPSKYDITETSSHLFKKGINDLKSFDYSQRCTAITAPG